MPVESTVESCSLRTHHDYRTERKKRRRWYIPRKLLTDSSPRQKHADTICGSFGHPNQDD
jgi:hypothetical protein